MSDTKQYLETIERQNINLHDAGRGIGDEQIERRTGRVVVGPGWRGGMDISRVGLGPSRRIRKLWSESKFAQGYYSRLTSPIAGCNKFLY